MLAVVLAASSVPASYRTYDVYAAQPAVFDLDTISMRAAVANLDRPGPVYLSSDPTLRGPYMAAWAYTLRGRELLGSTQTGFSAFANPRPGSAPAYDVIAHGEDPREQGLDPAARVWQGERADLYATPADQVAWLSGRPSAYAEDRVTSNDTTYSRAQSGVGSYLEALPDRPLTLYAGDATISQAPIAGGTPARRVLRLALGSFTPQTVEIELGDQRRSLSIPAGASIYDIGPLTTPLRISLRGTSAPLMLRWVAVDRPSGAAAPERIEPGADTMMIGTASETQASGARTRLQLQNATGEVLRLAVEIYQDVPGYGSTPAHYAWSLFPAPADGTHELAIDLEQPGMALDGAPLPAKTGELRDGAYFAALWVYQGEQVRRTLPFLRFERRGGKIGAVTPLDLNAAFVRLPPPAQPLTAESGEGIALQGFELSATRLRPGEALRASLLWQARRAQSRPYLVFVQLLDDADRKIAQWDGAAGGDWWPTPAWKPGQRIWQDVPLTIAADAPPGRYRLIAGLYDPASGARLRWRDGGEVLQLGMIEVRP